MQNHASCPTSPKVHVRYARATFCLDRPSPSSLQFQGQHQQTDISGDTEGGQDDDDIATGPESLPAQAIFAQLIEELLVALLSAIGTDKQHTSAVDGKQRADGVELGGEDLEHDEREGEL